MTLTVVITYQWNQRNQRNPRNFKLLNLMEVKIKIVLHFNNYNNNASSFVVFQKEGFINLKNLEFSYSSLCNIWVSFLRLIMPTKFSIVLANCKNKKKTIIRWNKIWRVGLKIWKKKKFKKPMTCILNRREIFTVEKPRFSLWFKKPLIYN